MGLRPYDNKAIRVDTGAGDSFEGRAEFFPAEYGFLVFEREEESLKLGTCHIFESESSRLPRSRRNDFAPSLARSMSRRKSGSFLVPCVAGRPGICPGGAWIGYAQR